MEFLNNFIAVYGSLINFIGINSLLALSLYVTFSAGMLSLGNAAFAGIGGYVSGILAINYGVSYLPALAAGSAAAGIAALFLGLPVLKLRGVFLAIATLGFGEVVRIAVLNVNITGGAEGLVGIPTETKTWMIYLTIAVTAFALARFKKSRAGMALACIREDEAAARALGINIPFYKNLAFVVGGVVAGLAGGMYAHLNYLIVPGEFGFNGAVNILIYNIVGGATAWYGPVLGATLLTSLPEILRAIGITAGPIRLCVNGIILLLVILFLPKGLISLFSARPRRIGPAGSVREGANSASD